MQKRKNGHLVFWDETRRRGRDGILGFILPKKRESGSTACLLPSENGRQMLQ